MHSVHNSFKLPLARVLVLTLRALQDYLEGAETEILNHKHADATISFVTKQVSRRFNVQDGYRQ